MAVRLGDDLHAGQVGRLPSRAGAERRGAVSSSASVRVAPATAAARGSPGNSSARSERSTAVQDGSRPTIGVPASAYGPRMASSAAQPPPRAVQLAGA